MDRMWKRPNNSNSSNNPPSPYVQRFCKSAPCSPAKDIVKKTSNGPARADSFHVVHKVPAGDTPYVRAKHVQLVDKEPDRAIALFWAAINAGDRVDSALKDMAIVMKQQNRPEEAIEAIKSLRNRCSDQAQESLDNVLLDLYKRCGRLDDQIALLKHKLNLIHQGLAFNGKRTKTARSQGKKFQVSIEQEATRLLGNLGWAYMQQSNYIAAEAVYRKALSIELDNNKMCNLGICLMHQGRVVEARSMLQNVKPASANGLWGLDSHLKSYERAQEMLRELEGKPTNYNPLKENSAVESLKSSVWQSLPCPWKHTENHQNEDEKLIPVSVDWDATALHATSGFGPFTCTENCDSDKGEDGFGNENVNINTSINISAPSKSRTPFGLPPKTEILSQRLDKICLKENGYAKGSAVLSQPSSRRDQSGTNDHPRMPFEEKRVLGTVLNGATTKAKRPIFPDQSLETEASSSYVDQRMENETMSSFLGQSLENEIMPSFLGQSLENETKPFLVGQNLQNEARPFLLCQSSDIESKCSFLGQSLEETRPSFIGGHSRKNEMRPATRRSLSFESIGVDLPPLPNKAMKMTNSNTEPLLTHDNNIADPWDTLGFIEAPDSKDFEQFAAPAFSETPNSIHPTQQRKCHGRLRVFQEMTLPPSPKA
ncbi:hypothetical protein SUGI_0278140 [Cryptomeria japonica]|nr:hypothetical protein SUGI_0278140 [Cryptomeria japonica]